MENLDFKSENRLIRHRSYRYIFPPMVGMIFAQMAPVVDSVFVAGSLGEEALSAVGIVGPLNYIMNIICALCGIGCGVVISRCSGTGEKAKASRVFTRMLIMLVSSVVVLSVLAIIFADPLLHLFSATPENYSYAWDYLIITQAGSIFIAFNFVGDYVLANDNNQNLALAGDIVGAVVNLVVDYVGLYIFHWGIWISAVGTVLGSVFCFLIYLLHLRKKDRLCRIVSPKRKEGDPTLWEILKPGSAEALMYFFFAVQLIIQNFVLREDGGTSGLGNSAIIENLTLVFTIVIAGCTDATFPMASAYEGEQNKSGMLMVKRSLTKTGFIMLLIPVVLLCIFPELTIIPYNITSPVMLRSLPFAIRLINIVQLFTFIDTILIDYLSATQQEKKANLAFVIQFVVQIPLTLILNIWSEMNSPWYAALIAQVAVFIYLIFFCGDLPKGIKKFHKENLLAQKGGRLTASLAGEFETAVGEIVSKEQLETVREKMIVPLVGALSDDFTPDCCFSILKRSDDRISVVLHYDSKTDLLEDLPEYDDSEDDEKKEEVPPDTCIRSEFLGMRRLMIILSEPSTLAPAE